MTPKEQIAELERGADEVLTVGDLAKKLGRGTPLRVKAGFDPTAPDLHLGHTVLLNKMRQFQQFGHEVTFLIGDFTGLIGDPSGRNATRPALTPEEIQANARTYETQVFRILDRERTRIDFNSRWLSELKAADVVKLQEQVDAVRFDPSLVEYVISLANATRTHDSLQVGLSPRGSLALAQAARATAILNSRDYAIPEDVMDNIAPVCAHRIIPKSHLHNGHADAAARILTTIVESLTSPA